MLELTAVRPAEEDDTGDTLVRISSSSRDGAPTPSSSTRSSWRYYRPVVVFLVVAGLVLWKPEGWPTRWPTTPLRTTPTASPSPAVRPFSSQDELRERHPHCFASELFVRNGTQKILRLNETARYVLTDPTESSPRYDHMSCFVMKARYNCATNHTLPHGENAYDWQLVLQASEDSNDYCNLRAFAEDLGGPNGLAAHLYQLEDVGEAKQQAPKHIILYGVSYFRQVWEALTCGWRHQITDYAIQEGGIPAGKQRFHVTIDEIGEIVHNKPIDQGCRDFKHNPNDSFFVPGVPVPPSSPHCNDSLSMVEFANGTLRFYFIFRTYMFENLTNILDFIGTSEDKAHAMFLQSFIIARGNKFYQKMNATRLQESSFWPLLGDFLNPLQMRDIGRWFGANNPRMIQNPDSHACMPGAPDDQADLLLYLLYHDALIKLPETLYED